MTEPVFALLLAMTAGALSIASIRFPIVAWIALAPLGVALLELSPLWVACAGGIGGALVNSRQLFDRTLRVFGLLASVISACAWSAGFGLAAWLMPPEPAWLPLVLPLTIVLVHLPIRLMGAPRWHNNPLAQPQERWLTVVHTARIAGDLTPTALLALSGSVVALLVRAPTPLSLTLTAVGIAVSILAGALSFGRQSLKAAIRRVQAAPTVRVAAVVANGPPPPGDLTGTWPIESSDYRDVEATVARYLPHIEAAVAQQADLVVLPEVGVVVDRDSREHWIASVASWAQSRHISIVAPFFDVSIPKNELVVVDAHGSTMTRYEKQHPVSHVEGKRERRMAPGPVYVTAGDGLVALSTVICVDLDYDDLVTPVREAGGILVAPSNDWPVFDELHHQSAIWSAVTTGVSVVRATGWGISAVYDGAGRVLARASSQNGPVVLTVDVPVAKGEQ